MLMKSRQPSASVRHCCCHWIVRFTACCGLLITAACHVAPGNDDLPQRIGSRRSGEDWPTLLGPRQDGRSNETGVLKDWSNGSLRIVWQRRLGEGYVIGSTAAGRYVQWERIDDEARIFALHAETGEELWEYRYPTDYVDLYGYDGGPRCNAVIDGGRVYCYGVEGRLTCLTLAEGRLLWSRDVSKDYGVIQNFFGVGSTPVIEGDLLWVMVGGSPPGAADLPPGRLDRVTGNGTGLVAFDKFTGEERLRLSDELASYASLRVVTLGERRVGLAFLRGGLLAFDPRAGEPTFFHPWRSRKLESVNASMPVVIDDRIVISETYGPGAVALTLGANGFDTVWSDENRGRDKALMTHWNTPVVDGDYLYASSGRHTENAELRCVDSRTGEVRWSVPDLTRCQLTYADGHLICLGEDGVLRLIACDPEAYREVTKIELTETMGAAPLSRQVPLLRYPCWAAPVLSHGLLYVRGRDRLVCLELIPDSASNSK